jgi:cellulose synthase operon protein C
MRHQAGQEPLRQVLNLAEAGAWGAAAAELTAERSEGSGLPAFPLLAAAVLLLADRRHDAIAVLAEAQRRDPADPKVNHMLLLAIYHTLRDPQASSRLAAGVAASLARHAIASWVVLVHQERFWTTWLADRLSRYGEDCLEAAPWRPELLAELTARIEELETQSDDLGASKTLLQRELAAAEQLAAAGGFPLPGRDAETLVCGTLMIQALGCQEAFGAFVASLPGDEDAAERIQRLLQRFIEPVSPSASRRRLKLEELERLRRSFSRLGLAQALLDRDRPEEAWAALAELACPECRTAANSGSSGAPATGWLPVVCTTTRPCFDRENPGYAGRPQKAQRLEREALELAIRIQLALAYAGMTALESDPQAVAQCFREALRLAAILDQQEATESRIVEAVLGRVKALADKGSLTPAIALLEAGLAACSEAGAAGSAPADLDQPTAPCEQLAGQLAELLTWRGIAAANDRQWEAAIADLRRAVNLNPHATNPLLVLSFALQSRARQLRRSSPTQAIELALEAVRRLQPRLPDLVGRPEAQAQLEQAREAARSLIHCRASDLAAASGFDQALQILEQGLVVLASDPMLTGCHREIVLQYARYLSERGQPERALAVLRRAK